VNLNDTFKEYEVELKEVEKELTKIFKSEALLIPTIGAYIINSGGKRLRPLFYFLAQISQVTEDIRESYLLQ